MRCFLIALTFFVTSSVVAPELARADDILNLGDPAPPLTVSTWIKGDKFEKFEPRQTYIIEFWATWCGPCRASIPHLTELAHKYKDQGIRVLGVALLEQDSSRVQPFVAEMGDQMDYAIAIDSVPAGRTGDEGAMAKSWMAAAAEYSIPTAFVIHDAKIAWIGQPMQMDGPLAKIIAGTWDASSLAPARLVAKAKERRLVTAREKIFKPYGEKDYTRTLAVINETIAEDPGLADEFAFLKFTVLNHLDDVDTTLELGTKLIDANNGEPDMLNAIAYTVVKPNGDRQPNPRLTQLALKAAKRAVELSPAEYNTLDTLACAYYAASDYANAISTEEHALRMLKEKSTGQPHPHIETYTKRLDIFRAALKEKPSQPQ